MALLEINNNEVHSLPRPSATVMVLRDGPTGMEVLMVQRHNDSGVLGGVHVFPGGKLDKLDCDVRPDQLDRPMHELRQALGETGLDDATAAGLHVAALRETFEESGLLLHALNAPLPAQTPEQLRAGLASGAGFANALSALSLPLSTRSIQPWSRWITPRMPSVTNKRFDARFFVAKAPADQDVLHDTHEVSDTVWLTPEAALRQYWEGQIGLVPAQILSLSELARYSRVDAALLAARQRTPLLIEPEPFDQDGARVICYPGDPRHSQSTAIWPCPTRMTFRNKRFEPEGGLAALLP